MRLLTRTDRQSVESGFGHNRAQSGMVSEMAKILPIIMCGGAGTRMWPESRASLPKQFHHHRHFHCAGGVQGHLVIEAQRLFAVCIVNGNTNGFGSAGSNQRFELGFELRERACF